MEHQALVINAMVSAVIAFNTYDTDSIEYLPEGILGTYYFLVFS